MGQAEEAIPPGVRKPKTGLRVSLKCACIFLFYTEFCIFFVS